MKNIRFIKKVLRIAQIATPDQLLNAFRYQIGSHIWKNRTVLPWQPQVLAIEPTGRCNLSCNMCHSHSPFISQDYPAKKKATRDRDINFETFKYVLDRFHQALHVILMGKGEALLNSDFIKMVEYAVVKRNMLVSSRTNGVILEQFIEPILQSGLHSFGISINGHNIEEYERLTGHPGKIFLKICENVRKLIEGRNMMGSHLKIALSFIIDQHNYRSIPKIIEFAESLEPDTIQLINFFPAQCDGFRAHERTLLADDLKVIDFLKSISTRIYSKRIIYPTLLDFNQKKKQCKSHFRMLRVDGNKNYYGCGEMLSYIEGNNKITDAEVWNSDFFQQMRSRFISPHRQDLLEPCQFCPKNNGLQIHEA